MISVIICTYNRASFLPAIFQNIQSLLLPKLPVEFIFIDNNSSDHTQKLIQQFINSHPNFNLRYILEKKQGISQARNRGIKAAQGEIITFLDDDSFADKNWLRAIESCFEETRCLAMGGKVLPFFESDMPQWLKKGELYKRFHGVIISHDLGLKKRPYTLKDPMPFGANMAFRKESFVKYGNFNTKLGRGKTLTSHEDIEFILRLLMAGEEIIYNPQAIIYHRIFEDRYKVGYFIRWMFYAGISGVNLDEVAGAFSILSIPSYKLRGFLSSLIRLSSYGLKLDRENYFIEAMQVFYYLGYFWVKLRKKMGIIN